MHWTGSSKMNDERASIQQKHVKAVRVTLFSSWMLDA